MGHRRAGYREGVRRVTEESERCQNAYRKFSGSCGWSPKFLWGGIAAGKLLVSSPFLAQVPEMYAAFWGAFSW